MRRYHSYVAAAAAVATTVAAAPIAFRSQGGTHCMSITKSTAASDLLEKLPRASWFEGRDSDQMIVAAFFASVPVVKFDGQWITLADGTAMYFGGSGAIVRGGPQSKDQAVGVLCMGAFEPAEPRDLKSWPAEAAIGTLVAEFDAAAKPYAVAMVVASAAETEFVVGRPAMLPDVQAGIEPRRFGGRLWFETSDPVSPPTIPEPGTMILLAVGAIVLGRGR